MVSYSFKIVSGVPQKSAITRVPDISEEQLLDDIVQNVIKKNKKTPEQPGAQGVIRLMREVTKP